MKSNKLISLTILLVCLSTIVKAQKVKLNDLAFMQGKWYTNHEWGEMEEYWGAPMGDNMVSSYRCVKNGKIAFYEFVVIEQTDSVPVMLLRHFGPKSVGWEDKTHPNHYPLASVLGNKAIFKSSDGDILLSYELMGPDHLEVVLEEKSKEGVAEKIPFHYQRKK